MKSVGIVLLLVGLPSLVFGGFCAIPAAPEIGPGSAVGAVALVSGALLIIRSRRRR